MLAFVHLLFWPKAKLRTLFSLLTCSDNQFRIEFLHCYTYFTNGLELLKLLELRYENKLLSPSAIPTKNAELVKQRYVFSRKSLYTGIN